jgi:hypothetical protein
MSTKNFSKTIAEVEYYFDVPHRVTEILI